MSNKHHSGSDMYKKHRDLIASIMEDNSKTIIENDGGYLVDNHYTHCDTDWTESDCDDVIPCDCPECGGQVYPHQSTKHTEEGTEEIYHESEKHDKDCDCEKCSGLITEDDSDFTEKAKKEIEDETDLAMEVAEENGQLFDNVKWMSWYVQEVADKIKESSSLDEKDMNMGHMGSKNEFKQHIANNFDHYKDNIARLYPKDLKDVKEIFLKFLKNQDIDKDNLEQVSNTLDKKIKQVGDAYDEMSNFIEMVKKYA